jgi:hypothetical protein
MFSRGIGTVFRMTNITNNTLKYSKACPTGYLIHEVRVWEGGERERER